MQQIANGSPKFCFCVIFGIVGGKPAGKGKILSGTLGLIGGLYARLPDPVLEFGRPDRRYAHSARSGACRWQCIYYFFIVVVIWYETTAAAGWTLTFILCALLNHTITVAVWTSFSLHDAPLDLRPSNAPLAGRSFQFGITSAPHWPQRSQRIHGPSDGTETSAARLSTLTIASWRQVTFEQWTITDRTPFALMLPSVIGAGGGCMCRDYH